MASLQELTGEAKPSEPQPEAQEPEGVKPAETTESEQPEKGEAEKANTEETEPAKSETAEPEKPESPPDEGKVPVAALQDERSKRQKAEKRIAELESKQTEKEPPPSVFDDEEKAFKAREESVLSQVNQTLFSEGEAIAIELHDEDTVKAAVAWAEQAASESPTIAKAFQGIPLTRVHRKAVELYQQEQKRAEMADPDAYRKQVEAEVRAELEKESKAKAEEGEKLRESIPPSLVGEPSKGSLKGSSWSGPTPLGNVIGKGG